MDGYYLRLSVDSFNALQNLRDKQKRKPILCQCKNNNYRCINPKTKALELSDCLCCGRIVPECFMGHDDNLCNSCWSLEQRLIDIIRVKNNG